MATTATTAPELSPLNDFIFSLPVTDIDTDGSEIFVTTGTVSAFLATSPDPTADAADDNLRASLSYTGANGVWLGRFDAATLTPTLLDATFATTPPYLIVQRDGGFRVYEKLKYKASRKAD